ncbi:hypothetical protein LLEC1_00949 [Akanthomyces lecanii]|uniref:RNA polymerase II holoenzyme cyclin-like subunit n=1 Tax=Cordyceps confragosa TaxID=2714763 RepID=A0A179ILU4_CORDF|nr:hypothetical protein LLEC1_00949 [Akanthomyces lecanii]
MSANYWDSTQRRYWLFTKDQLNTMRTKLEEDNGDLVRMFPLSQPRHLAIFFNQQLIRLGKRLTIRQQAMATAQVYLKRFYSRVEIRRTNPYLVITTAIYLACKMEESPQHIRLIVTEARQLWQDFIGLDTSRIGECEFFLISEMSSQLIVHQPYRTLTSLRSELALAREKQQEARITRVQHFAAWLAESTVDIASMVDATQEIISFYECYEKYNEKLTREQINRFVKAGSLDR